MALCLLYCKPLNELFECKIIFTRIKGKDYNIVCFQLRELEKQFRVSRLQPAILLSKKQCAI